MMIEWWWLIFAFAWGGSAGAAIVIYTWRRAISPPASSRPEGH